jgi:adenylate cyclase class IV
MQTEIEMRARFDQATHDRLIAFLHAHGEDLGQDDKHIYFYVLPDQLLKVVDNIAAVTAKISLKGNKIGRGAAFPELEIPIQRGDAARAVQLFNALGLEETMHDAFNQRHNFRYQGVEIAVKWSEAWGHHAEFEVLLDGQPNEVQHAEAAGLIRRVAGELGVELMSEDQLAAFVRAFEEARAGSSG